MNGNDRNIVGFKTYFIVWICLMALTAITVTVASLGLGRYGSLTSVFIASLKATLILLFFMHLKYEKFLIMAMLLLTIFTIAVIIGLTFFDVGFRYIGK